MDTRLVGGIETVKRCVAAGLGLALLPTVAVADELADARLIELQPPGGLTPQHLWLAWPSSRWRSPALRAVHATLNRPGFAAASSRAGKMFVMPEKTDPAVRW